MAKRTNRPRKGTQSAQPIFVPKVEKQENEVAVSLDESLDLIKGIQQEQKELKNRLERLKKIVKDFLRDLDVERYESPAGRQAVIVTRQNASYDRELIRQLTGENFGRCVRFSTSKSIKIT